MIAGEHAMPRKWEKKDFRELSDRVLSLADKGRITFDLLRDFCFLLMDLADCDLVKITYVGRQRLFHCDARKQETPRFFCDTVRMDRPSRESLVQKLLCREIGQSIAEAMIDALSACTPLTAPDPLLVHPEPSTGAGDHGWRTLLVLPIPVVKGCWGVTEMAFRSRVSIAHPSLEQFGEVSRTMGLGLSYNGTQFQLRERLKELTCMYGITNEAAVGRQRMGALMERIVSFLPPAYLYPDIAEARILLDGTSYKTLGFPETGPRQSSDIVAGGVKRGEIEVVYRESRPTLDEGPFLLGERTLLDSVAREVGLIVERYQVEQEQEQLREQIRHTDRLATIGQLAAGIAHELNEPLTGILGFAELLKNADGLPQQVMRDIIRIESAALHAREVVRKLLLFAKQIPPKRGEIDVAEVIRDVVGFLEHRFMRDVIRVECDLPDAPIRITADESQIRQIVLNLVVNAVQAMPGGGALTITARGGDTEVSFSVRDTGLGMLPEVREKIFLPFFTTKDIHQGTGLGLSVVHGIVRSHHGRIEVDSEAGKGSLFTVTLPARWSDDGT